MGLLDDLAWGPVNPHMICAQCQTRGQVRTKAVKRDKGISARKTSLGLLTFGTSLLLTGLSRKEKLTQAHCDHCGSHWDF